MSNEHATSVAGEGKNPTEDHIMLVAKTVGLSVGKAVKIIKEVRSKIEEIAVSDWSVET
jgi:hypothetical protein